jgi:hypothetical protein
MLEGTKKQTTEIKPATNTTPSSSRWAYDESSSNGLLKKFRNYEI